jgi:CRP-like cAMP-binding protein
MALKRSFPRGSSAAPAFDAQAFLDAPGMPHTISGYARGETIFTQGDTCEDVLYIQGGSVKLSVMSKTGREAVVAVLGPGDFFGEACLAGLALRAGSATAVTRTEVLTIGKQQMVRLLRQQHAISDRFITHMLSRGVRIEEDLIDQLFNSIEKRLARVLLLKARYGRTTPARLVAAVSTERLADVLGTTVVRVASLMKKFTRLGFIEARGATRLKINNSLLTVVLRD